MRDECNMKLPWNDPDELRNWRINFSALVKLLWAHIRILAGIENNFSFIALQYVHRTLSYTIEVDIFWK